MPSADYSASGHVTRCGETALHRRLAELACTLRAAGLTPEEDAALSARCEVELRPRYRSGEGSALDVVELLNTGLERGLWTVRYYKGTVAVAELKLRRELARRREA